MRVFVYLALSPKTGLLKIGASRNPYQRLASLSNDDNGKMNLLHAFEGSFVCEKKTHKLFAAHRSHGEWFHRSSEIYQWFDQHEMATRDFTQEDPLNDPERAWISKAMQDRILSVVKEKTGIAISTLIKLRDGKGNVTRAIQHHISHYLGGSESRNGA